MRLLLTPLFLASAIAAQVAPGEAIQSFFTNFAPIEGLAIVNRAGTHVPVTNVAAQSLQNLNSVALDPIDNSIWLGSITTAPTTHGLRRATLAGTVLGPAVLKGTLPTAPGGSFSGISFDQNGNPIVSSGAVPPSTGGVFRVNRHTGAVTNLLSPHPAITTGTANCVDVDLATGDIYFGVTAGPAGGGGRIYALRGPFPNTTAPVLLGACQPVSTNATISGVAFRPAIGIDPARVYWTNFGAADAVGYVPAAGGPTVLTPGVPTAWAGGMNWISYDRAVDDFWVCSAGINPDRAYTMSPTGANVIVTTYNGNEAGTPSAIDANDAPLTSLRVIPQFLPTAPAVTTVEVSLTGQPGEIGVLGAVVGVDLIILGAGVFDASGAFWLSFPLNIGAGSPGAVAFLGARISAVPFAILDISAPIFWPGN